MIVGIATPSAQALVAATKSIPIVFSTVTDPVGAHLTPSWEASGTNVTGVSDMLALDKQIELIKKVVPGAKRIGMVYNPGEANSVVVVKELKELLPKMGLSLVEASAPRSVDVSSAARSLVGKVDAIYTNTDNNVVSAYEALVKVGNDAKIPLIASDTDSVKRGAIAALGINYKGDGQADRPHGGAHPQGREAGRDQAGDQRQPAAVRQSRGRAEARRDPVRRTAQVGRGSHQVKKRPPAAGVPPVAGRHDNPAFTHSVTKSCLCFPCSVPWRSA